MPLTNREEFTDESGQTFLLERVDFGSGDVVYYLTTPDGRRRLVRRKLVR